MIRADLIAELEKFQEDNRLDHNPERQVRALVDILLQFFKSEKLDLDVKRLD